MRSSCARQDFTTIRRKDPNEMAIAYFEERLFAMSDDLYAVQYANPRREVNTNRASSRAFI